MKAYNGGWGIDPLIPNLGARWRCVVNLTLRQLYARQEAQIATEMVSGLAPGQRRISCLEPSCSCLVAMNKQSAFRVTSSKRNLRCCQQWPRYSTSSRGEMRGAVLQIGWLGWCSCSLPLGNFTLGAGLGGNLWNDISNGKYITPQIQMWKIQDHRMSTVGDGLLWTINETWDSRKDERKQLLKEKSSPKSLVNISCDSLIGTTLIQLAL